MNPFLYGLVAKAATGDLEAQRSLARLAVERADADCTSDPYIILMEGLVFARLAAAHGERSDADTLDTMLGKAAQIAAASGWAAAHLALQDERACAARLPTSVQ